MKSRKMLLLALGYGFLISLLLWCFEWLSSRSSPFALAMPGWLVVIYFWGFDGGKGIWPTVAYVVGNTLAYSLLVFILLILRLVTSKNRSLK